MEADAVLFRLPGFSRGLKLVRIAVFVMLAQLVLSVITTLKSLGAETPDDVADAVKWIQYLLWANIGATFAMLIGSVLAVPDFRRARLPIRLAVIAAAGFAVATAALWWSHHVIGTFVDVMFDPASSVEAVNAAVERMSSLRLAAVVKDLAYVIGLIAVIRTVRQSAVANDQLALRYDASNLTGLIVVMLLGDLFYQVTYGLGGGGSVFPLLGLLASVLVGGFWIYCHVRLTRFLENSAYFVNEPHQVPVATIVDPSTTVGERPLPRSAPMSAPRRAPTTQSAPVIVVAPELRPAPAPRTESVADDDAAEPPRFLG